MSKIRVNQLETLDGLNTKDVSTLIDDIESAQVTTSTGTQTLVDALDSRAVSSDMSVTPEEFGAVGDGVTDDTTAVQSALDSGSPVNIAASYLISAPLIVPRPSTIFGEGTITTTVTNDNCLEIAQGTALVDIRDITLVGPHDAVYTAGSNGIKGLGTSAAISENITVIGVTINKFGDNGVRLDFCDKLVFKNNLVDTIGRAGLQFRSCHNAIVEENEVRDITPGSGGVSPLLNAYGIQMTQSNSESRVSEHFQVLRNKVIRVPTWTGIDTHGGQHINVQGNRVQSCPLGIVMMGPGGGSTATTSASFCNVIDNYIYRDPTEAANSRAGIAIVPSSSGVSAAAATDITVRGNWVERYGGNVAGSALEGAIRIQDVLGLACEENTVVDSTGIGIEVSSGTFGQVFGNVNNNHVTTVLQHPDGGAFFARFSSEAGRYVFDNNLLYRSGGDAIAIDANVTPTSSDNGCIFGSDNELINFVDNNAARKRYSTGTLNNLSRKSRFFLREAWRVGVSAAGAITSGSPAISSVTKGATGVFTLNYDLGEFSPGAGSAYHLVITGNDGSPVIFGQSRTNADATITGFDVAGNNVDRGFTAVAYWVFTR